MIGTIKNIGSGSKGPELEASTPTNLRVSVVFLSQSVHLQEYSVIVGHDRHCSYTSRVFVHLSPSVRRCRSCSLDRLNVCDIDRAG